MRAIIRCKTNVEPNELDALLIERAWYPTIPQDHTEALRRKKEILDSVAPEDLPVVEATFLVSIHDFWDSLVL